LPAALQDVLDPFGQTRSRPRHSHPDFDAIEDRDVAVRLTPHVGIKPTSRKLVLQLFYKPRRHRNLAQLVAFAHDAQHPAGVFGPVG